VVAELGNLNELGEMLLHMVIRPRIHCYYYHYYYYYDCCYYYYYYYYYIHICSWLTVSTSL
jgi:hypothetical protein